MKYKVGDKLAVMLDGRTETQFFVHHSFECKVLACNDGESYYVEVTGNISKYEIGKRLIIDDNSHIVCINDVPPKEDVVEPKQKKRWFHT